MKAVVIYDQNKIDSVYTAAAMLNLNVGEISFTVAEKSEKIDSDFGVYYWLGVLPSRYNFFDWKKAEEKNHYAFTDVVSMAYCKHHVLKNVNWYGKFEGELASTENSRTYGKAMLLERVFEFISEDFQKYIGAIDLASTFYKSETPVDALVATHVNMKSALYFLKYNLAGWTPTIKVSDSDYKAYQEDYNRSKDVVYKRSSIDTIIDKKDARWVLITTYEQENFWLTRRAIKRQDAKYRNISVSGTGVHVITNTIYADNLTTNEPSFVE